MEDALKFRYNFKHVHNLAHRGLLISTKTAQSQPQQITANVLHVRIVALHNRYRIWRDFSKCGIAV